MTQGNKGYKAISNMEDARKRNYTDRQRKMLEIFADQGFTDPRGAAELAGYPRTSSYQAVYNMKKDLVELSESILIEHAPEAARSISNLMMSDEIIPNATVKLNAAKDILDRIGLAKQDKVQHEHNVSGGIFILPAKNETVIEGEVV